MDSRDYKLGNCYITITTLLANNAYMATCPMAFQSFNRHVKAREKHQMVLDTQVQNHR